MARSSIGKPPLCVFVSDWESTVRSRFAAQKCPSVLYSRKPSGNVTGSGEVFAAGDPPAYRFSLCDVVLFTIDFQTLLCSLIQSNAEAGMFGIF